MRRAWSVILAALIIGVSPATAQVLATGVAFSVGGGLTLANQSGQGEGAFFRLSSRRLPFVMDLSFLSVPGQAPIVFAPGLCKPTGCVFSTPPYNGSVTALTLAPALQLTEGHATALLYRLGPALTWLPDRAPGEGAVGAGFKAGITLRLGVGTGGLLLSGDYLRLLRAGSDQQWFLPITVGWQF